MSRIHMLRLSLEKDGVVIRNQQLQLDYFKKVLRMCRRTINKYKQKLEYYYNFVESKGLYDEFKIKYSTSTPKKVRKILNHTKITPDALNFVEVHNIHQTTSIIIQSLHSVLLNCNVPYEMYNLTIRHLKTQKSNKLLIEVLINNKPTKEITQIQTKAKYYIRKLIGKNTYERTISLIKLHFLKDKNT